MSCTAVRRGSSPASSRPPLAHRVALDQALPRLAAAGAAWLTIALLLNSVLSLFYYLRWIAPLLRTAAPVAAVRPWGLRVAIGAGTASVVLGLGSAALWQLFGSR